jgi:Na+/H+-translocating membrane pyrophosphatase
MAGFVGSCASQLMADFHLMLKTRTKIPKTKVQISSRPFVNKWCNFNFVSSNVRNFLRIHGGIHTYSADRS